MAADPTADPLNTRLSTFGDRTEPLTPIETEAELSRLISAITTATIELAAFRKKHTAATLAWRKARLIAAHSRDCPKPRRGSGDVEAVTVDQRAEWIDNQVIGEYDLMVRWETMKDIGIEGLRATLAQAEVVRSLNSSVRAAYQHAGYQRENQ